MCSETYTTLWPEEQELSSVERCVKWFQEQVDEYLSTDVSEQVLRLSERVLSPGADPVEFDLGVKPENAPTVAARIVDDCLNHTATMPGGGEDITDPHLLPTVLKRYKICSQASDCIKTTTYCDDWAPCCSGISEQTPGEYFGCAAENRRYQDDAMDTEFEYPHENSTAELAIPWPSYICQYRVKKGYRTLGYAFAEYMDFTVHQCARRCSLDQDRTGCVAFDWRPPHKVEMRQPNCLLHSVTAALVRKFAFGASRGSGWSYFERRNAIGDEKKSVNETVTSGEDIFNTCGKGVGRQMPPKRGGAVAFMRSLPSRRQPFFGSKDDEELNEEAARIHGSGKRALPNEGRGFTEENVPKASLVMQTDGFPEDGRLPGAATVAARPAMLLFGGVYDDGCTSSDTWLWTDKDGWGYRAETGVLQRTALPDPLCDASAAPTKSLVNMVNHLREAHIPSWRTYSMRRLGVADYEQMKAKTPITADLCPPAARVDAHGQAWGDRFVVFGGAMFKKGKSEHQSAMEDVQNPMEAKAFTEYGLYDLLKHQELGTSTIGSESINPYSERSHSARAQQLFADVWVLEQRWGGGAFSQMNWFWTLIKPQRSSLVPMGRYDGATMLDETRNTLYVFGGRSYNRSFNDLWTFDLLERVWREISPARGDRPEPRHGAAIAPLNYATSFPFGTLLMSFGRDLVDHVRWPHANATVGARLFREIWYFDSISGWHKLDTQALCGCDEVGWDPHARVVRHPADCGTCAKKKCAEGRWGHSMVIPPAGRAGRNNQVAHALFIGGWGEDGRTVRSVLRLNFEKQINTSEATNYSHADGLCESANGGCTDRCTTDCFENLWADDYPAAAWSPSSMVSLAIETCEAPDACAAEPLRAPRVDPEWACTNGVMPKGLLHDGEKGNFTVEHPWCAAAHTPVICQVSGKRADGRDNVKAGTAHFAVSAGAAAIASNTTRGIDATRDNWEASKGGLPGSVVEAGVDKPCRVTTNDAELADLRWSDYAMYWDQAGDGPSIIYYAGSRTNGIETIPLDPLSPAWTAPPPSAPPAQYDGPGWHIMDRISSLLQLASSFLQLS